MTTTKVDCISTIPNEIHFIAMEYMSLATLLSLQATSRRFRALIAPMLWRRVLIVLDSTTTRDTDRKGRWMCLDGPAVTQLRNCFRSKRSSAAVEVLGVIRELVVVSEWSTHGAVDWIGTDMARRLTSLQSIKIKFNTQAIEYPLYLKWMASVPGFPEVDIDVVISATFEKRQFKFPGNVKSVKVVCYRKGVQLMIPPKLESLSVFSQDFDPSGLKADRLKTMEWTQRPEQRLESLQWVPTCVHTLRIPDAVSASGGEETRSNIQHLTVGSGRLLNTLQTPNIVTLRIDKHDKSRPSAELRTTAKALSKMPTLRQLVLLQKSAVEVEALLAKAPWIRTLAVMSSTVATGSPTVNELMGLMRQCHNIEFMVLDCDILARCGFVEGMVIIISGCLSLKTLYLDSIPQRWVDKYGDYFVTCETTTIDDGIYPITGLFLYPPVIFNIQLFIQNYF